MLPYTRANGGWVWLVIGLLGLTAHSWAAETIWDVLPPGSQVSLLVQPVDDLQPVVHVQPDVLRLPASTLKLLTALAAGLYLGKAYRFETRLLTQPGAVVHAAVQGDVTLQFVGDPSLSRADLVQLFQRLKAQGIQRIRGDLVLDDLAFNGYDRGTGWPWDDLGICYTAPASAIVIDHNCVDGVLYPSATVGARARVVVIDTATVTVSSQVVTLPENHPQARFCTVEMRRLAGNRYELFGCVTPPTRPLRLAIAVTEPAAVAQATIQSALVATGIQLDGHIRMRQLQSGASQVLARHTSVPLAELTQTMLKTSDNLISDTLLKTLGRVYFQQPGNYRNGTAALKAILRHRAGIELTHSELADGSGLSRYNLLTARQLLHVLRYMHQHDKILELLNSLPVAGVDGTLRRRLSLWQAPLKGRIQAKTGAMKHVFSLAGFLTTAKGRTLLVVLLINSYYVAEEEVSPVEGSPPLSPLHQFEQGLFTQLYHEDFSGLQRSSQPGP